MFASEPLLTITLFTLFALVGPPVLALNRGIQRRAGQMQRFGEEVSSQLVESIGGYRDIMAAGHFDHMADRFQEVLSKSARTSVTTTVWAQSAGIVIATATSAMMVIPYFAKVHSITSPADVGRVITYVILLSWVMPSLSALARSSSNLALAAPSLRAVRELLGTTPRLPGPTSDQSVADQSTMFFGHVDHIRFENVGLNIDGRWLVDDLNFEIPGGQLTAIIGQSGAGKTTIFHILLRLMRPTKGAS